MKPELSTSKQSQSGKESVWSLLWKARSSWQLCTLLSFCSGVTSLETQSAQTFCIFKSSRIIAWTVTWHWHDTSCSPSMITFLFFVITQDTRRAASDALAVGRWPGPIPILTVLCPFVETFQPTKQFYYLGQHLHMWLPANKLSFHKIHMSHLCPRQLSSIFHRLTWTSCQNGTHAILCHHLLRDCSTTHAP